MAPIHIECQVAVAALGAFEIGHILDSKEPKHTKHDIYKERGYHHRPEWYVWCPAFGTGSCSDVTCNHALFSQIPVNRRR